MANKRPTSIDVAKLAGVSRTTVSFVLNNYPDSNISENTRQRVIEAARQLNYHPNASGRKLASGKSKMIGLVRLQSIEQVFNDAFLLQVFVGIEQAASKWGFHVLLKHLDHEKTDGYSQLITENHVDGIILSGPLQNDPELIQLHKEGVPIILLGQMANTNIPFVDVNAEFGSKIAVDHLISCGHKRIAMITNAKMEYSSAQQRKSGYLKAIKNAKIKVDESLIKEGDFTPASGYEAMKDLLSLPPYPTAVFVASDVVAIGAIQAIKQAGLRIPQDIEIIGFDDVPMAEFYDPPLSTVRLPAFDLGRVAGDQLIKMILGNDTDLPGVLLETELILRESTSERN
ncbi:MAG: LacI family transcriptional regulator [Chloroflexi bacterium HGW-Chloroflexi-5]|nr:MAG: LacI family transcriptional regulator [Chloroflexi bacterium HGW-Chloroflexi-5]